MRTQWNDREHNALRGLSMLAQLLYLRVFRRRMHYQTGIAGGHGQHISTQALIEEVSFVPDARSSKKAWKPSRGELRAAIAELERPRWLDPDDAEPVILLVDMGSGKEEGYVKKCVLADLGSSAQNMNNPRTTQEQPREQPREPQAEQQVSDDEQPGVFVAPIQQPLMSNPPSGEQVNREEGGLNRPVESALADCDDSAPAVLPVRHVFDYWRNRTQHKQAKLGDKRRRAIAARLKEGYTVDDLKQAIDGCMASPWHQGQNGNRRKYDDIELICRDASKVDQFIGLARDKGAEARKLNDWLNSDNVIEGECHHVR
jgi:uncharacterized phage protein (TIGR02220 family)